MAHEEIEELITRASIALMLEVEEADVASELGATGVDAGMAYLAVRAAGVLNRIGDGP